MRRASVWLRGGGRGLRVLKGALAAALSLGVLLLMAGFALNGQTPYEPPNPLQEAAAGARLVPLAGAAKAAAELPGGPTPEMLQALAEGRGAELSRTSGNGADGSGGDGAGDDAVILNGDGSTIGLSDALFSTTLEEPPYVYTSASVEFSVIHHNIELALVSQTVSVNGGAVTAFPGKGLVRLEDGDSLVAVQVTYRETDGTTRTQTRHYTVRVNTSEVQIYAPELLEKDGQTVYDAAFSFSASAQYGGEYVALEVKHNGSALPQGSGRFSVTLAQGENVFELSAKAEAKTAAARYTITCQKPETAPIEFWWDGLSDGLVVTEAALAFSASAWQDGAQIPLMVYHASAGHQGDDSLVLSGSGSYTAQLEKGENIIQLFAGTGENEAHQDFLVILGSAGGEDPLAPVLRTSLVNYDGTTIYNDSLTFEVSGQDYHGAWLRADENFSVECPGANVPVRLWENDNQITYRLTGIQVGKTYTIQITLTDYEGHSTYYECTFHVAYKDTIRVRLSIEATTVGLGYILPPVDVEVPRGQTLSRFLVETLYSHGFVPEYTGTVDSGFYLAGIMKDGIAAAGRINIPADLAEAIENDPTFDYLELLPSAENRLGEFDFTYGSGWMYSVNGSYPNVGFSDYVVQEGDVIRGRFTLAYGRDIGGSAALGTAPGDYEKEW